MPSDSVRLQRRARNAAHSLGLLALSCSGAQSTAPAWPSEPPPDYPAGAYPAPAQPAAASREAAPETANPAGSAPRGSSEPSAPPRAAPAGGLAARYGDRPALDTFSGKATYYADSLAGNRTASGERYDPTRHSAAHRKLPFGTVIRVIRSDTGAVTYAKVNDRGPFAGGGRIVDLSRVAAEDLQMMRAGVVPVRVEVVGRPE